ncbi:PAS domain S-box protein [Dyadobacter sp. CY347]|uniref:PAS domain-containing response regulator n=1 Tax=Dyadobacter sp. CY347 TaxID=2909336 RepID=UPI001F3AF359|nr:PAS domain S-box protein [Dyadobacter sp. CY347]MCF2488078.1 PAS domain S-box protein [Dyadobacter sp. CY347]
MDDPVQILYFETDPTDAQRIREILTYDSINYQLLVVVSQAGFKTALEDLSVNIILAGHPISSFSCQEALHACGKYSKRIPMIIIASELSEESAIELVSKGADDYILKDRLGRLPIAIRLALKNSQHEQEKQAFIDGLAVSEKKAADLLSNQNGTALREKAFQANLLDTIGQAAIATDLKGQVIFWNKAAEQIYGWTAHEAMHANIMNLIPSIESRDNAREIMAVLKAGRAWTGEFKAQHKNGRHFPAAITNSPIYDQHQKITGIIGISSDITDKKALEERLDSTSILAKIGIYDTDLVNNRIFWSNMTRQIHDVGPDYIPTVDHALSFFKEGFSRNAVTEAYQQAREDSTAFDLEVQMVTAEGNLGGSASSDSRSAFRVYVSVFTEVYRI